MGEVIHMGNYLRSIYSEEIPELSFFTDDEVITFMLCPEEEHG